MLKSLALLKQFRIQFSNLKILNRSAKSSKLISLPCVMDPDLKLFMFESSSKIGSLKKPLSPDLYEAVNKPTLS